MPYEVVARRWRPQTFESVVGQRHVTATLTAAIASDRVAHAFLFTGIRGVGKTTVARILARALNCESPRVAAGTKVEEGARGTEPCNECPSCKQVLSGASVDVIEIDGASNNGIDEVRALIEASQYRPATGRYRIYIIDEVHQLSKSAFNALLKTLEEPPDHVKFILATTEVHKVLETVLSRCQRYDFRRLSIREIVEQLALIVARDELDVSDDALALIAREADGSMRDAQSLLEQLSAVTGGSADAADVTLTLGVAPTEVLVGIVTAILKRDGAKIVELSGRIREAGHDPERVMHEVLEMVRHVCVAAAAGADALDDTIPDAMREAAVALKDERHVLDVHRIFNSLMRSADDLRHGSMSDIVFEMGLLKAVALESVLASGEILAMLDGAPAPPRAGGGAGQARGQARGQAAPQKTPPAARQSQPARAARASSDTQGSAASAPEKQPNPAFAAGAQRQSARQRPTSTQATAPSPPDPSAAPEMPPHPADAAGGTDTAGGDSERWKNFLETAAVAGGIKLTVALGNCELIALEPGRVVIRPMTSVARKQIDDSDMLARLRQLVADHFGPEVKLEVDGQTAAPASGGTGISSHSIEEERRARVERDALADPLVKGAVDLLGGRVRKIQSIEE